MALDECSVKIRRGPPDDGDGPDAGLGVWAGEIPLRTVRLDPVPDPALPTGIPLPPHLSTGALAPGSVPWHDGTVGDRWIVRPSAKSEPIREPTVSKVRPDQSRRSASGTERHAVGGGHRRVDDRSLDHVDPLGQGGVVDAPRPATRGWRSRGRRAGWR